MNTYEEKFDFLEKYVHRRVNSRKPQKEKNTDTEAQHAHPKPTCTEKKTAALQKHHGLVAAAQRYKPPYSKDRDPKTNPLWCYIPWCTRKKPFNNWSKCLHHVRMQHLCGSWAAIRDSDLCRLGKAELNVKEKERHHRNKSKAKAAGDAGVVTPAPKRQRGSTASNQPLGDGEGSPLSYQDLLCQKPR